VGIRGANRSYYLFDGLGSVVALTNASGSVTNSYAYDPFGVTTETKALLTNVFNPWRYTGQYQDTTTGLYKMGARYYQPELGRWTQVSNPSGSEVNAYAYVGANPVNFIDPSSLNPFSWILDALNIKDALEDLLDEDQGARDLLDNLAGGAGTVGFATACA
jgi:RHS repeat-associated protein